MTSEDRFPRPSWFQVTIWIISLVAIAFNLCVMAGR